MFIPDAFSVSRLDIAVTQSSRAMGTWRLALLLVVMVVVLTEANRSRQRDRFRQRDQFRPRHTGGSDQEKSGNSGSKANSQDDQGGSVGGGGLSESHVERNRARNRHGEEGSVRRGQDEVPERGALGGVSGSAADRLDRRDRHRHRHSRRRRTTSTSTPVTPALAPNVI